MLQVKALHWQIKWEVRRSGGLPLPGAKTREGYEQIPDNDAEPHPSPRQDPEPGLEPSLEGSPDGAGWGPGGAEEGSAINMECFGEQLLAVEAMPDPLEYTQSSPFVAAVHNFASLESWKLFSILIFLIASLDARAAIRDLLYMVGALLFLANPELLTLRRNLVWVVMRVYNLLVLFGFTLTFGYFMAPLRLEKDDPDSVASVLGIYPDTASLTASLVIFWFTSTQALIFFTHDYSQVALTSQTEEGNSEVLNALRHELAEHSSRQKRVVAFKKNADLQQQRLANISRVVAHDNSRQAGEGEGGSGVTSHGAVTIDPAKLECAGGLAGPKGAPGNSSEEQGGPPEAMPRSSAAGAVVPGAAGPVLGAAGQVPDD